MSALFDKVERDDDSPAWRNEDSFTFLNRAAGVVWQRQRDLLEAWYLDFPDADGDLRARFRRGAAGRKISAVLTGVGMGPGSVARFEPTLWHHYAPRRPLTAAFPIRSARAINNDIEFSDATAPIASIFGLPADWPGPEPAFPRLEQH